jgi:hypothetical protein
MWPTQMSFGRIKWKNDIVPLSDVQEIDLFKSTNGPGINFYYKATSHHISRFYCESEEQRDWLLNRINEELNTIRNTFFKTDVPHYSWIDLYKEWEVYQKDVKEAVETLKENTLEQLEGYDVEKPEEQKETPSLEEPDNRPSWKKLLNIS